MGIIESIFIRLVFNRILMNLFSFIYILWHHVALIHFDKP
ncbi:hypothetical protein NC99_14760 [Sunxiuqinia dokdonensis]|uniref:Uncharacterized protein n=1 Tax=Sunxiuqinia dokdonensis TaxID=1409788 RepID=A0A0L8VB56_9BACT|nr:hypothetical protein NC99_14760 [Sunxiuqinia dokdonensis]